VIRSLLIVSVSPSWRPLLRTPQTLSKPSLQWPDRSRKEWALRPPTTSQQYKLGKAKEFSPAPLAAAADLIVWDCYCIGRHLGKSWFIRSGRELCVSEWALSILMTLCSRIALFHYLSGRNGHPPILDIAYFTVLARICRLD
jgi:hypothetical protein